MADFLDTNVLVYQFDASEPAKSRMAEAIVRAALETGSGIISYQVVQETLNVLGKGFGRPVREVDRKLILDEILTRLWIIQPSADIYRLALSLIERFSLSFYDSLIVSAAISGGCDRLLTEDLQHGQIIEGVRIINPFLAA